MRSKTFVAMAILLAFGIYAPRVNAGQTVVGVYKVTGTTDLGSQVRITMQITLINSGTQKVVISEARLRSLSGASAYEPLSLVLEPNVDSQTTQDFTVAKSEYLAWNRNARARPHLGLKVQIDGIETILTIPLFPLPGTK
jgi:hypothetical protein